MRENPKEEKKTIYQLSEEEKHLVNAVSQSAFLFFEHERNQEGEPLDDYIHQKRARFYNHKSLEDHLNLGFAAILDIILLKS